MAKWSIKDDDEQIPQERSDGKTEGLRDLQGDSLSEIFEKIQKYMDSIPNLEYGSFQSAKGTRGAGGNPYWKDGHWNARVYYTRRVD